MPRIRGRRRTILAIVCAVVGTTAAARAQSAADGFNPGANGLGVLAFAEEPDGKIVVAGGFTMLGGGGSGTAARSRIGRLYADGSLDPSFNPGANGNVNAVVLQPDGKVLVCGEFTALGGGGTGTTVRNAIGRINPDGSLDAGFNPGASGGRCNAIVLQPDGRILVGGFFTGLGGGAGTTPRHNIGRLNSDGSIDTTFNPGANSTVSALALQADGKILVGGSFTTLGGGGTGTTVRNRLGRLNVDGSLDAGFNPGANQSVFELAVQPDGNVLVAGFFTGLGGGTGATPRAKIGRIGRNGTVDASFNPGATGTVSALALQADGKILVGGTFTTLGGGSTGTTPRSRIGRLLVDGSVDASFNPGSTGDVFAVMPQLDSRILVGGFFAGLGGGTGATPRSHLGRLYADGSLDADLNPGANGLILAMALQPDGQVLVGGGFTTLGGGSTGTTSRSSLGRLAADGALDPIFNPGANGIVRALAVQPDGKILVGGQFTTLGGGGTGTTARSYLARLNADGSLDPSFNPGASGGIVEVLAVQADGKILVGGQFTTLGGGGTGTTTRHNFGRLNADGSLDTSFDPGANGPIRTLTVQPDGGIVVGGGFTMLGGGGSGTTPRRSLGRLAADGSLDPGFNPGANGEVYVTVLQPDGRILVAGQFTTVGGGGMGSATRSNIGRLNADGSVDASFDPGANDAVTALTLQSDGRILVGGSFTTLGGGGTGTSIRNYLGRLNADGSIDPSFDPGANALVSALAVQPDGKIVVSGSFATLGGGGTGTTPRNRIGRLTNTHAAIQRLSVTGGGRVVTWARSGAGPDVSRVTFEFTTDGATYASFGTGTRVAEGWQVTGPGLPTDQNVFIRARGYYATGYFNGSGSIVESALNLYVSSLPSMGLDKTTLRFAATSTGAAFTQRTESQIVRLTQSGTGTVTWTATPDQPWITVSPASGSGSATLTVGIAFVPGLPVGGSAAGSIALAFTGAGNDAGPVGVGLTTIPPGASTAPFGVVDTPVDGTTGVTGSIAVTGWALDDIEVRQVRLWRDPVAGEGASQVFIGNAVFVDGSRPDVATLYPTAPRTTRAGWGYLLLTNFLPSEGNGTFTLRAYADDADGHSTLLGSKTITCANATATRPFGAIDTPAQGEVVSGTTHNNFGWVLTRGPALAYPPFGTVSLVIDGVFGAAPVGWTSRSDLTALFPATTYPGVTNALGVTSVDTTALTNGVHTIAWVVTANDGQADGIGSRYFTVSNGTALQAGSSQAAEPRQRSLTIAAPPPTAVVRTDELNATLIDRTPVAGRRGYDLATPLRPLRADDAGRLMLDGEELDRLELQLTSGSGQSYTGFLRVGDHLAPLPIGSHLDPGTGVFTWQAGVGFIHAYDLVFVRWIDGHPVARHEVRIVLHPKGSRRVGPQVLIDTPSAQAAVVQPFLLAGWALDRGADVGTGVDAVHVWAYPITGDDPIFVGVAAYGGHRPDVGSLFGERFAAGGYGLVVAGLAQGSYDLAVFAWSTAQGRFVPARVVRVIVVR